MNDGNLEAHQAHSEPLVAEQSHSAPLVAPEPGRKTRQEASPKPAIRTGKKEGK